MKAREEMFAQAEQILVAEQASVAPLTYSLEKQLVNADLSGYFFNGAGGPAVEFKTAGFAAAE